MQLVRSLGSLALITLLAGVGPADARRPATGTPSPTPDVAGSASVGFGMHASFNVTPSASDCENNPGPFIRLDGSISLGGLDARLRFTNNARGTHEHDEDITADVELVSEAPIVFAKQPSSGGVGGNPHLWLQITDCATSEPVGGAAYLGRCVQGFSMLSADVITSAFARAVVTSGSCSGSGGPNITLEGALTLGGICGTLVFTNNDAFTHVHEEDVAVELSLLEPGQRIVFAKQPPLGGVGGNPHIYLQFLSGDGSAIGSEFYLGRCHELSR